VVSLDVRSKGIEQKVKHRALDKVMKKMGIEVLQ
jgi:hypothetical protein